MVQQNLEASIWIGCEKKLCRKRGLNFLQDILGKPYGALFFETDVTYHKSPVCLVIRRHDLERGSLCHFVVEWRLYKALGEIRRGPVLYFVRTP